MSELVSIITPACNTGKYIAETIQSVISQTYANWEMLIVDDCSTDNTRQIIESFHDNRIKYYKNTKNIGAGLSRNFALNKARGKWIAFLDSDDIWMPEKLEKQISFMKINNINYSYTKYEEIDESSKSIGKIISGPKNVNKFLMKAYCWPGCLTIMYNADEIGMIQIADLKKNNDYAMWLKIIKKSNCYLLDQKLAKYRKRTDSLTNGQYYRMIKHHYLLWRVGEDKNLISSLYYTALNILFGIIKKIIYVKRNDASSVI